MNTTLESKPRTSALNITFETEPQKDLLQMLSDSVYGTPGGILYRHLGTEKKIQSHKNLTFLTVRRKENLFATIGFIRRNTRTSDSEDLAFYIRYLCVHPGFRTAPKRKSSNAIKEGSFAGHLFSLMEKMGSGDDLTHKRISYAFVEDANQRSRDLSERFGYRTIRKFNTILFSRFFPKKHKSVKRISEEQKQPVQQLLSEYYKDHTLYFEDHLFFENNYFVMVENGEIIAGVQANPVEWEFHDIPGFNGFMMLKVLPKIPVLRRLFKRRMRFVAFESLYLKPGHEHTLTRFFEAVCAENKVNMGTLWLDDESELFTKINSLSGFGLLKKLKKGAPVNILAKFDNYSIEEIQKFKNRPVFLSSFDMT